MASHEGSRKKRKMSATHDAASAPCNPSTTMASSSGPPLPPARPSFMTTPAPAANAPCHHELALKALNTDLDAMRHLITCKICDRFLYEPYALSCGHTYCYSCLSQWLGSNAKMTCPDCRTVIKQQPTPSYLIRELVLVFVGRNELLPDGETAEEHNKLVREEAEIVARDKATTDERTGGLFKGRFNRRRLGGLLPLHDPGDGVHRCPECHWELEGGHCEQCGYEVDDLDETFSLNESLSESDLSEDDVDQELGDMDDHDVFVAHDGPDDWGFGPEGYRDAGLPAGYPGGRHTPRFERPAGAGARRAPIDLVDDEESSDGEMSENDYDHDDTFINDGTILDEDDEDSDGLDSDVTAGRDEAPPVNRRIGRARRTPVVISDDEDGEDGEEEVTIRRNPHPFSSRGNRHRANPIAVSDDEEEAGTEQTAPSAGHNSDDSESDSEDDGPVVRGSQRNKRPNVAVRPRRAVTVSSDADGDESDHDDRSGQTGYGGFSPPDYGVGDGTSEHADHDSFYDHDFEDEDDDANSGFNAPAFDPYGEDASLDGHDEESDDGWGTARNTTTTRRNTGRTSRQPRMAPGPGLPSSSRLGTLQQRRSRHASPQRRHAPTASPTRALRTTQPRPGRNELLDSAGPVPRAVQAATLHNRTNPQPATGSPPTPRPPPTSSLLFYNPNSTGHLDQPNTTATRQLTPHHPFQLDNILARLRGPDSTDNLTNTSASGSNYNRRNLEGWNAPYDRNAPTAAAPSASARARRQLDRLRAARSTHAEAGSSTDGRRKRAMSVESDDSQEFYV